MESQSATVAWLEILAEPGLAAVLLRPKFLTLILAISCAFLLKLASKSTAQKSNSMEDLSGPS